KFFRLRQAHTFAENGEVQIFNAGKQSAVGVHEEPESGATFQVDQTEQRGALPVILPCASGLKAQEFANAERRRGPREIFRRYIVLRKILRRNVDAAHGVVVVNVANDIGELE